MNGTRPTFHDLDRLRRGRDDDVDLHPDEFLGERLGPVALHLGRAPFDVDVLAFDIPQVAQPLAQGFLEGLGGSTERENAEPRDLRCWLGKRSERRGGEREEREYRIPSVHPVFLKSLCKPPAC